MRIVSLLLLLACSLAVFSAHADIYRWVDAQGRVMYGDDPPHKSGAKSVELPMLTVADSFVPQNQQQSQQPEKDNAGYSDFKITTPASGEAARANGGNLTVTIGLKPKLKDGDSISLYLDSKQVASGSSLSFSLSGVERGKHTVFAILSDAEGNIIQNTETVTFNTLQHADMAESDTDSIDSTSSSNTSDSNAYQDTQTRLQENMYGQQPKTPTATTFSFPSLPGQ